MTSTDECIFCDDTSHLFDALVNDECTCVEGATLVEGICECKAEYMFLENKYSCVPNTEEAEFSTDLGATKTTTKTITKITTKTTTTTYTILTTIATINASFIVENVFKIPDLKDQIKKHKSKFIRFSFNYSLCHIRVSYHISR